MRHLTLRLKTVIAAASLAMWSLPVLAQDTCANRGQLDTLYCDEDNDLVADTPKDPAKLKDPSTLIFAYSAVEAPQVYQKAFQPLMDALAQCTNKKVVYFPASSPTALIEAMRSGRLHIADFGTGSVGFGVNLAGAVPIVAFADANGIAGYKLAAIVRADSPFQKLADLKGKRVAHTSPSSNSGNLAPRVFFPENGLVPDTDYKPLMSGGHDKSVLGVGRGDYDMAAVASDVMDRILDRGDVKRSDIRIIYESKVFPTSQFSRSHDLKPELAATIQKCFLDFKFPPEMSAQLNKSDRFVPITYKETWAPIREIAEKTGTPYNKAGYEAQAKREAEALAKKEADAKKAAEQPAEKKAP
jgi:phosphonate transport system substrate-binding protein